MAQVQITRSWHWKRFKKSCRWRKKNSGHQPQMSKDTVNIPKFTVYRCCHFRGLLKVLEIQRVCLVLRLLPQSFVAHPRTSLPPSIDSFLIVIVQTYQCINGFKDNLSFNITSTFDSPHSNSHATFTYMTHIFLHPL